MALLLRADQHTPRLLLIGFVFWILSPFVILVWADRVATRWSPGARATLHVVTVVITLAALAVYGGLVAPPAGAARGFAFVIVAPVSWVLIALVVGLPALFGHRR